MKFHDLAVGQRFELGDAVYAKTSPVLASREDSGEKKFLARYVVVQPLDGAEQRPAEKAGKLLRAEAVLAAFDAFHARCQSGLAQLSGDIPADKLDALTGAVEEGRKVFLDTLSKQ